MDDSRGYGIVSRTLHWLMVLLLAWQFTSALLHFSGSEAATADFFWGTHKVNGLLLLIIVLVRGVWGLINLSRRGRHGGRIGRAAALGHATMYALMVIVPGLGILRQYGSGRMFEPFGLPLMPGFEGPIGWMVAPGNTLHGLLGWILLALILGHIAMVFVHQFVWREDVLGMMTRGRGDPRRD